MSTPIMSFEAATNIYIMVLENSNATNRGREEARKELLRYARELDRLAAATKTQDTGEDRNDT